MTAEAATIRAELRSTQLVKLHRLGVIALAVLSVCFVARDLALDWNRGDLLAEGIARLLMTVLAVFCACVTKGNRNTRLLMWALLLLSFDVYWQTAYGHGGVEWLAMAVKYLALPIGLMCLVRFCANFGDGDYRGLRARIYDWAPVAAIIVAGFGLARGVTWIHTFDQYVSTGVFTGDRWSEYMYNGYLISDAALRFTTIVAAVTGLARSSEPYRSQLALIVCSCAVLALGTILDFAGRIPPAGSAWRTGLMYLDASTTLLFPIGLSVALFARQLFDVNVDYVLRRAMALTIATGVTIALFSLADALLKTFIVPNVKGAFAGRDWIADASVGFVLVLFFQRLEKHSLEAIDEYVLPARKERLSRLRAIGEGLLQITSLNELFAFNLADRVKAAAGAQFVDVFLRNPSGTYKPMPQLCNEGVPAPEIDRADPLITDGLRNGKHAVFGRGSPWPNGGTAFPMFAAADLYGFV